MIYQDAYELILERAKSNAKEYVRASKKKGDV